MMFLVAISSALACALLVWSLCFRLGPWLNSLGLVDHPNSRSSHSEPTLRGGGVAIIFVTLLSAGIVAALAQNTFFLITVALVTGLAWISYCDDRRGVPVAWRFGCHAILAVLAIAAFGSPTLFLAFGPALAWKLPGWASALALFLWLVGYTNAFNFMDGINGLAAGQAFITGLGAGCLAGLASGKWSEPPLLISFSLAGAVIGFLPHNFPRAKMFMGDVGSAPLGFLLAVLTVFISINYGAWLFIPLVLLHANFVLDTAITLGRRILRGEQWYAAHREHFYQRLVRAGKGHTFVTCLEMSLQIVVLALMVIYLYSGSFGRLFLSIIVLSIWLSFFTYCEMSFRRSRLVSS